MAFFAPFLAPVIGSAIGGIAATAIGKAVIGVGLSIGANYLTRRKQPERSSEARGMSLSLRVESNEFREVILGRAATAGSLKYHHTYGGATNDYLQLVYVLADHECDGLQTFFVDGIPRSLGTEVTDGPATGRPVDGFDGVMWIKFHNGAWDQSADADLVAKNDDWGSSERGRGVCYARITLKYSAEKFPNGIPSFLFVVRGAKLYDWREDSTNGGSGSHRWDDPDTYEYSDNPAVCLYNWMRGIHVNGDRLAGMNCQPASLPVAAWTSAANACDESVSLKAGGTERRYRMGGVIPVNTTNSAVVTEILASMAGELIDSGGVFKPLAGVAQASVMTITDDDLMADAPVEITPKLSRGSLVNAVFGTFQDPSQVWEPTALPPRISPSDEESDGGIRLEEHYGLSFVWSGTQGQRVLEILRRKGRYQRRVSLKLRSRFVVLEAGDWVTWNSDRYGYDGIKWEVLNAAINRDLTVSLELREINEDIFSWTAGEDELDPDDPKPVGAGATWFDTVQGAALFRVEVIAANGIKRPGLRFVWDPIDDETITGLELEYRQVGDTVALSKTIVDLSASEYTWVDGVQGGVLYEARLRPITIPKRSVNWTGWHAINDTTAAQVVHVANIAMGVPPDTITPEMLSAQARFELWLVTATDEVLGSMSQQIAETREQLELLARSTIQSLSLGQSNRASVTIETTERVERDRVLAQQITTAVAQLDGLGSAVQQEITARIEQGQTLAQLISTATTTANGASATAQVAVQSFNGIRTRIANVVNSNGHITGYTSLDGSVSGSTFTVAAGSFRVALLNTTGGAAVPVFAIANVNGSPKLALRGDMLADGSIAARHISAISIEAIAAAFNSATFAGIVQSANTANGKLLLNFANPRIELTTA